MITRYAASYSSFRAKATVYWTLSTMRGLGDYLVRQGPWKINPFRWTVSCRNRLVKFREPQALGYERRLS